MLAVQATQARSRLIGTDEPGDQPANLRFARSVGRFREVGGGAEGDLASVLEYYQSLVPGWLVILGEPGAGKTVLALELQVRLLEARRYDPALPVPVLISAAACDTALTWEDWLTRQLAQRFALSTGQARRLIRDGRILPLVDGLDEMDQTTRHDEAIRGAPAVHGTAETDQAAGARARKLVAALNAWMSGRKKVPAVVTCRRAEYQALPRAVDRATHIELLPLDGTDAGAYLRQELRDASEDRRWASVLAGLRTDPDGPLAAQLGTPWRLNLALTAFRDRADPAELLPGGPDLADPDAYGQRIETLLLESYLPAMLRLHDPGGRYRQAGVRRWLTALADSLAWQAEHGRSATDIDLAQRWRPVGRRITALAHAAVTTVPALVYVTGLTDTRLSVPLSCVLLVPAALALRSHSLRRIHRPRLSIRRLRNLGSGLGAGLTVAPSGGSSAWTRYHITVVVNAARGRGPLRFGAFLDWAHQAGLLRVSGIAYQFQHQQLQDWLASPSAKP